jgi:arylsulfatase A-like enzyme/Flp pilus assembly protein TadD
MNSKRETAAHPPRLAWLPAAGSGLLAATLAGLACTKVPATPKPARHLVLVTIDTLRADRLSCYGSREVATPHLDRLAREGAMAPEAMADVALTRPSHVSLFTGLHPYRSGIRDNVSPPLAADVPTLASHLESLGFATGGFVSAVVLSKQSGLGRGFDVYADGFPDAGGDDARFLNSLQKRGDQTLGEALRWLEDRKEERVFLWLHLYDPHDPYEPPEPFASQNAGRPYDGEVAYADHLVGRLDEALAKRGLRDDALVVVTADHGEGLGDHDEGTHGFYAYQSTLRVPLILRGAGIRPGTRLPVVARLVDVMPTVLDLLGVARPAGATLDGRSLADALRGGPPPAEAAAYAESLLPLLHFGWSDLRVLREGRWKYIEAPRPELYDLRDDPGETRNLAEREPLRSAALRGALAGLLAEERTKAREGPAAANVPPDLLEKLGALGYLGAGSAATTATPGADPKDRIGEYKVVNRLVREGLRALRRKDFGASAASFREVRGRGISSFEVHYYLGRALVGLGQPREAVAELEAAVGRLPGHTAAWLALAESRSAAGDPPRALADLRRAQQVLPRDPRLVEAEAHLLRRLGRTRETPAVYERAVALAPEDALLRVQLGEAWRDAGDFEKAVAALREAVRLDPAPASYWNSLGMALGAAGRITEAEGAFREAVERNAGDAQYAYNTGLALLRQGRKPEAKPFFERALALEPRFAEARARLRELR